MLPKAHLTSHSRMSSSRRRENDSCKVPRSFIVLESPVLSPFQGLVENCFFGCSNRKWSNRDRISHGIKGQTARLSFLSLDPTAQNWHSTSYIMWIFKHLISCCYISKDSLRQFCSLFHVNLFFNRKESQRAGQTLVEGTHSVQTFLLSFFIFPIQQLCGKVVSFFPHFTADEFRFREKKKNFPESHIW